MKDQQKLIRIALGLSVLIFITPFFGLPTRWLLYACSVFGAIMFVIVFQLRASLAQKDSEVFSADENTSTVSQTESQAGDTSEHRGETINNI